MMIIDAYDVTVKNPYTGEDEYYGTVHVPTKSSMHDIQEHVDEVLPRLKGKKLGQDYHVKFLLTTPNDNY